MTPDQEDAFIAWVHEVTRGLVNGFENVEQTKKLVRTHRDLCAVFGYTETHIVTGYPVKPKPHLATSDPEGHQQAITDADYDAKHALLWALVAHRWSGVPMTQRELAADIMRLWSELKAIMEPEK